MLLVVVPLGSGSSSCSCSVTARRGTRSAADTLLLCRVVQREQHRREQNRTQEERTLGWETESCDHCAKLLTDHRRRESHQHSCISNKHIFLILSSNLLSVTELKHFLYSFIVKTTLLTTLDHLVGNNTTVLEQKTYLRLTAQFGTQNKPTC